MIAAVLNTHLYDDVFEDTIDSIKTYCTKDVLVLVDGCSWGQFEGKDDFAKMCGFKHGVSKSPFRNMALGMMQIWDMYPDKEWYLYCERDVLFGSSRFIPNLQMASDKDVWMMGFSGHVDEHNMPLVESMLGEKLRGCYYLLGCCMFFHNNFMKKLDEINFFERFLNLTNSFSQGVFPSYGGYDISEHLYPTMCRHFGGNIGVFSSYEGNEWHGHYEYYPVRWQPSITEGYEKASILHPSKEICEARLFHQKKRKEFVNEFSNMER